MENHHLRIEKAIQMYLAGRKELIELGKQYPEEIGGNDNMVGRIGEYFALRFLRAMGQAPKKAATRSNAGFDFVEQEMKTQVKVITAENESGKNVRLKMPWTQFVLLELGSDFLPSRIGLLTVDQLMVATQEHPSWSSQPIVKRTMLSEKGLIGLYGKVFAGNEIRI